jgi:hypothetical protein
MLTLARPEFRFPTGLFVKEDTTRVKMLTPGQETPLFAAMAEPGRSIARLGAWRHSHSCGGPTSDACGETTWTSSTASYCSRGPRPCRGR